MVRRYSHTAIITIPTGALIKGEWVSGKSREIHVKGRYYPSNSGEIKSNPDGKELPVHGEFSTKARPIEGATRIRIDAIGLDAALISWEPFQSHSVIYV